MTVPSYTTDLADIATADESTGWAESGTWNDGSVNMQETDYYIQGSYCVSSELKLTKSGYASLIYNYGSNLYSSFGTDYVVLAWMKFLGPNVLDTDTNGGIRLIVGSGLDAFRAWNLGGSESYKYGGWINMAVAPSLTGDYTVGSPGATTWQYFGVGIKEINPISKGNPFGVDAIRYGRAQSIFEYGETADYCTFAGYAAKNDANDATNGYNRWGLLQAVAGGYLFKGLMSLGTTTNAVDFRDSNVQVIVDNTKKVTSGFNKIEVRNASSRVDWTSVSLLSLGTVSPGAFEVVDNADVNFDGNTFTDLGAFTFLSGSTILSTTWRRCGLVTQNDAVFTGCLFTNSNNSPALLVSDLDVITNCNFVSAGTGYAIELTTAHAGGSFTLTGCTYSGYGANLTTNAVIYNNSGGAVTINVSGGDTPTYNNGSGASTNIVAGSVTVKIIAQTATGTKIENATAFLACSGTGQPYPVAESVTISNSGTTATVSHTAHGLASTDKIWIKGAGYTANNGVFSITYISANSYSYTMGSSPGDGAVSGTITATFVLLKGLTNASGEISMSRVFSADQEVTGWARKSTASPLYKEGPLSGVVDSAENTTFTAILSLDE